MLPGASRVVPVDVGREDLDFYDRRAYWEQELLPATLASGDYDAYFGPTLVLPLDWPGPKVVAVHDLAFEVAPDFNTPLSTAFYSRWARASAEAADGVVAISQATANDLEQRWGICETVTVTPLASCLDFVPADREQSARLVNEAFGFEAPFALNVGGNFPRKNLRRLLQAARQAHVGWRSMSTMPSTTETATMPPTRPREAFEIAAKDPVMPATSRRLWPAASGAATTGAPAVPDPDIRSIPAPCRSPCSP